MLETVICAVALVLILIGIWHEEKIIAFEDRAWEYIKGRTAYVVAKIYLGVKKVRINRLVKSTDRLAKRVSK